SAPGRDRSMSAQTRHASRPAPHVRRDPRPPRFLVTDSRKARKHAGRTSAAEYAAQLRAAELRVTRPRVAALGEVHAHAPAEPDAVIRAVRASLPEVSHQTVYDSLNALTAVGLLRRIQPSGSVARYEARVGDNHHHIVCRSCGDFADVDCA